MPRRPAIGRTVESPEVAGKYLGPKLILEPVTHAGRSFVDGEPFLIAAVRSSVRGPLRPGLSAICGAPDVAAECVHQQAQIVKISRFIVVQHRIAAENVVLQNAWKMPRETGVRAVTIAALAEVRCPSVKLPPADGDLIAICRVNCDRRLVRGVTDDVVTVRIDVHLITDESGVGRNHSRRTFQTVKTRRRRGHLKFFERLWETSRRRRLRRSEAKREKEGQTSEQPYGGNDRRSHVIRLG